MAAGIKIGSVARCKNGIIGIIDDSKGDVYFGLTLNNKAWQSIKPEVLAESLYDYIMNGINNEKPNFLIEIDNFINEIKVGTPIRLKKVSK